MRKIILPLAVSLDGFIEGPNGEVDRLVAETVEINVFDWNVAGIRCYKKCGFVVNPGKEAAFQVGDKADWP